MDATRPQPTDRALPRIVAATYLLAAAVPLRVLDALPVVCPFRRLTGLPCPGCGGTHAFVACAHGEWAAAWAYNPLGVLAFAAGLAWLALRCVDPHGRRFRLVGRAGAWSAAAALAASLAFGAWRAFR